MKYLYFILITITFSLSSFKTIKPCEYAGSNIGFVKTQTQKAINEEDINISKYHTYKAIRAIENNKEQLSSCGCESASLSMDDSFQDLVLATKAKTIRSARILLNRSLEKTLMSLDALEKYELNDSNYANDVLTINTLEVTTSKQSKASPKGIYLERKIDSTLLKYEESLSNIVQNVNCKDALNYATRIFEHCEEQLLKPNLSESKKYYNLRTKEITAQAIEELNNCNK